METAVAAKLTEMGYTVTEALEKGLKALAFKDGTRVLRNSQTAIEFLGMCDYFKDDPVLARRMAEAAEFETAEDYIWTRGTVVMRFLASTVKREESMKLFKPKAITNLEPCKRCGSKNIRYAMKQTRALDEGQSVLIQCANCGLSNRVA